MQRSMSCSLEGEFNVDFSESMVSWSTHESASVIRFALNQMAGWEV